jgi:hypothetical protein
MAGPLAYATTDLSNGITVGGMTIAPLTPTNDSNPADAANNPTVITFADGTKQQTSATNLSAMMAVIFGG